MSRRKSSCDKSRRLHIQLFDHLYEFDPKGDRLACAYCGDVRETIDHIPSISVVAKVGTKQLRKKGIKTIKVPCCRACNQELGALHLATFEERLGYLYDRLLRRTEKSSIWSPDELDELAGELKRMIGAKQEHIRREVLVRLRGMEKRLASLEFLSVA